MEVKEGLSNDEKITKTVISEKDKEVIIVKKEPVNGKPTSSKIEITKGTAILQMKNCHLGFE